MDELELPREKIELKRDEKGRLLPGQTSLNPAGKPVGTLSIKTKIVNRLQEHPKELLKIIKHIISKEQALLFQMIDIRPHQSGTVEVSMPESLIELIKNVATNSGADTDVQKEDSE